MADGVGDVGSRVARSVGVLTGRTGKGLARGTCFVPLLFVVLALALLWLPRASVLPRFISPALLGVAVGVAPTVRAQVKGYKGAPLLLYTDTIATSHNTLIEHTPFRVHT